MGRTGQTKATTKALFVFEIETEKCGSARFTSSDTRGGKHYERELTNALFRLTGCHDHVWGHYGTLNDHGGLNVDGQFSVKEIREGH